MQVTVKSGPIEGVRKVSRMETPYLSFQRIPYAKPPLGKLRFKVNIPLVFFLGKRRNFRFSSPILIHKIMTHFNPISCSP